MTNPKPIAPSRRANSIWLALALTAVLAAALPLFAWFGYTQYAMSGVHSAVFAFGVCTVAGVLAILVSGMFVNPQLAMAGLMASMLFRMGLPLGMIAFVQATAHPLRGAGLAGMIMAYYLLMLVVETPLTILLVRPDPTPTGAN